jgi:hypothetical protein
MAMPSPNLAAVHVHAIETRCTNLTKRSITIAYWYVRFLKEGGRISRTDSGIHVDISETIHLMTALLLQPTMLISPISRSGIA